MTDLLITAVDFVQARPSQIKTGLLGHVSIVVDDALKLDGISLRRTRRGYPVLVYSCRRSRDGRDHPYIRPVSDAVRRRIEREVFRTLGLEPGEGAR